VVLAQGLALVALGAASGYALHKGLHRAFRAPRLPGRDDPADYGVQARPETLPTQGGKHLFAWYCPPPGQPSGPPAPALVAIHGWGANADTLLPLAGTIQSAGYGLLLLDARCHGRSDDDSFASLPRFAEDLSHGVDWLRNRPEIDPTRIAVMGHSVGAGAALLAGSRRRDLAAVISLAAFAHPEEVMRRTLASWHVPYRPLGWVANRYVEHIIGHRFPTIAPLHTVTHQHAPVLLMHGTRDTVVSIRDMDRLHAAALAAGRTVESAPLSGATHEGRNADTGDSLLNEGGRLILAFLTRHVPVRDPLSALTGRQARAPQPFRSGPYPMPPTVPGDAPGSPETP